MLSGAINLGFLGILMRVIPVIDVKSGIVVHARGGNREAYQPIASPLAASARPEVVIRGLNKEFEFATLYVADLDAISGASDSEAAVLAIVREFPHIEIWLDAGRLAPHAATLGIYAMHTVRPVIGTESLATGTEFAQIAAVRSAASFSAPILSLDYKAGRRLGADISIEREAWPETVIVMTLDRVGAGAGPDLDRIAEIRKRARRGTSIVAAGGVRDKSDLVALMEAGADAALVATALHAGTLKASDLDEIAGLQRNSRCS